MLNVHALHNMMLHRHTPSRAPAWGALSALSPSPGIFNSPKPKTYKPSLFLHNIYVYIPTLYICIYIHTYAYMHAHTHMSIV